MNVLRSPKSMFSEITSGREERAQVSNTFGLEDHGIIDILGREDGGHKSATYSGVKNGRK